MLDAHFGFNPNSTSRFTSSSTVTDSDTSQSPKFEICSTSSPLIVDSINGRSHNSNSLSHPTKQSSSSSFSVEALLKDEKSSSSSSKDPSLLFSLSHRSLSSSAKPDLDSCHFFGFCPEPYVVRYNSRTLSSLREWSEQNQNVYRNGLNSNMIVRQPSAGDLKFSVQSILASNQLNGEPKYSGLNQFKPRGKMVSTI